MKKTELESILLAVFVAVEGAHAFSAFNPSIFTIHRFKDELTEQDIKKGCALASAFCILLGATVSGLTQSWLPVVMSMAVAGGMSMVYWMAVKGNI